jgi:hypothetical protein
VAVRLLKQRDFLRLSVGSCGFTRPAYDPRMTHRPRPRKSRRLLAAATLGSASLGLAACPGIPPASSRPPVNMPDSGAPLGLFPEGDAGEDAGFPGADSGTPLGLVAVVDAGEDAGTPLGVAVPPADAGEDAGTPLGIGPPPPDGGETCLGVCIPSDAGADGGETVLGLAPFIPDASVTDAGDAGPTFFGSIVVPPDGGEEDAG